MLYHSLSTGRPDPAIIIPRIALEAFTGQAPNYANDEHAVLAGANAKITFTGMSFSFGRSWMMSNAWRFD